MFGFFRRSPQPEIVREPEGEKVLLGPGESILSVIDPPPPVPVFLIREAFVIFKADGLSCLVCSGSCPSLDELKGWALVMTWVDGELVFGGAHPKIRNGALAPFTEFFRAECVEPQIYGLLEAQMHVDVLICRKIGEFESFMFRFFSYESLSKPGRIVDRYGRIIGEVSNSREIVWLDKPIDLAEEQDDGEI